MSAKSRSASLSSSQEDILHLWTYGILVLGNDHASAKVVVTKPPSTTSEKKQRIHVRVVDDNVPAGMITSKVKKICRPSSEFIHKRAPCSYTLRASAGCLYTDPELLNNDDMTYCMQCQKHFVGVCSSHFVLILNEKISRDGSVRDRARLTAPWPLYISESKVQGGGEGVWTSIRLPQGLVFGPYEGHYKKDVEGVADSAYAWILNSSKKCKMMVDSEDKTTSNWLRYVNCPRTLSEMNLEAFQYKGNIYYTTLCDVESNSELMVWYGDEYGKELGIPSLLDSTISMHRSNSSLATDRISMVKTVQNILPSQNGMLLSKSQSEFTNLFKVAKLEPDNNNTVKVVYINSKNVKKTGGGDCSGTSKKLTNTSRVSSYAGMKLTKSYNKMYSHVYCIKCNRSYSGLCRKHSLVLILDTPVSRDGSVKERARLTAPWPITIAKSQITGAGEGVWTSATLPEGLLFGPCEGQIIKKQQKMSGYGWEIRGRPDIEIDAVNTSVSNWVRYLSCARNYTERNLMAVQIRNEIFYVTICTIKSGTELLVWYGDAYGEWLGISVKDFLKPQLKEPDLQQRGNEFKTARKCLQHEPRCLKKAKINNQKNDKINYTPSDQTLGKEGNRVNRKHSTGLVKAFQEGDINGRLSSHWNIPKEISRVCNKTPRYYDVISLKCSDNDYNLTKPHDYSLHNNRTTNHSASHKTSNNNISSSNTILFSNRVYHGDSPIRSSEQYVNPSRSSDHSFSKPITNTSNPSNLSDFNVTSSCSPNQCISPSKSQDLYVGPSNSPDPCLGCSRSPDRCVGHSWSPDQCFCCKGSPNRYIGPSRSNDSCANLSRSLDQCVTSSRSPNLCVSPSRSPDRCLNPSRSPNRCISPSRSPNLCVSPSRSPDRCLNPSRSPNRCISPSRSSDQYVSPSRSLIRCVSPSRSPNRCVSPSRSPSRCLSPSRSPNQCLSPSKSQNRCLSPSKSPIRCLSPIRSPIRCLSPIRSPIRCLSPIRSPIRCLSPIRSPNRCVSPSRSPSQCVSPSRSPSQCLSLSRSPNRCVSPSRSPSQCVSPSRSPSQCLSPSRSPKQCINPSGSPSQCANLGRPANHPINSNKFSCLDSPSRSPDSTNLSSVLINITNTSNFPFAVNPCKSPFQAVSLNMPLAYTANLNRSSGHEACHKCSSHHSVSLHKTINHLHDGVDASKHCNSSKLYVKCDCDKIINVCGQLNSCQFSHEDNTLSSQKKHAYPMDNRNKHGKENKICKEDEYVEGSIKREKVIDGQDYAYEYINSIEACYATNSLACINKQCSNGYVREGECKRNASSNINNATHQDWQLKERFLNFNKKSVLKIKKLPYVQENMKWRQRHGNCHDLEEFFSDQIYKTYEDTNHCNSFKRKIHLANPVSVESKSPAQKKIRGNFVKDKSCARARPYVNSQKSIKTDLVSNLVSKEHKNNFVSCSSCGRKFKHFNLNEHINIFAGRCSN
ncbi:uncharacterized protein [Procambarus clarkii]|uniref:uncharacterized protein n=1 Tax=Procambarus clarkii TaxID=6728 RepID=UPI0037424DDF